MVDGEPQGWRVRLFPAWRRGGRRIQVSRREMSGAVRLHNRAIFSGSGLGFAKGVDRQ
jgi:hypothetical protein